MPEETPPWRVKKPWRMPGSEKSRRFDGRESRRGSVHGRTLAAPARQVKSACDVHVRHFPYGSTAIQFSARVLDVEQRSNRRILDMKRGAEPDELGHPSARLVLKSAASEATGEGRAAFNRTGPRFAVRHRFHPSGLAPHRDMDLPKHVVVPLIIACALFIQQLDATALATALPGHSESDRRAPAEAPPPHHRLHVQPRRIPARLRLDGGPLRARGSSSASRSPSSRSPRRFAGSRRVSRASSSRASCRGSAAP